MEVIDRYVYAVIKRLPEKSRAEVERELRANIEDMLPETYEEADVHKALLELGNPAELAEQYRETKRFLISPALYGSYIYVLRVVLIVIAIAIPIAAFVTVLTDAQENGPIDFVVQMFFQAIAMVFQAVFIAFGAVTLVFAFIDRLDKDKKYAQWPYTGKPWAIKDLQEVPATHSRSITKSESIFLIVTSVFFGIAICFYPELLGWYSKVNSHWSIVPLFNESELRAYVPFLLALTAFSVILATLKLIQQKWTVRLAWLNVLFNICNIAFVCAFLLNSNVFSNAFVATFAMNVDADLDSFKRIWEMSIYGIVAFSVIASAWDGINGLLKAKK